MQFFVGCGFVLILLSVFNTSSLKSQNCFSSANIIITEHGCGINYGIHTFALRLTAEAPEQPSTFSIAGSLNLFDLQYGIAYEFEIIVADSEPVFFFLHDELNQCEAELFFEQNDYPYSPQWQLKTIELAECRIEDKKIKQLAKVYFEHNYPIEKLCDGKEFRITYLDATNTYQYEELGDYLVDTSYLEIEILGYKQIQRINSISMPDYDLTCNLSDESNTDVFVFPTVAQSELFIHIKNNIEPQLITIHSINGNYIDSFIPTNNSIDISSLMSGIYVLSVTVNQQSFSFKVIKT